MDTAEIYERVKEILVKELGVSSASVDMDTSIRSDLGADDTDLVDILLDLEETFDISITDSDFEDIDTVGDAVEYIKSEMD